MSSAQRILAALGGSENIIELQPSISRIKAQVRDAGAVDELELADAGALGMVRSGNEVQVVVGSSAAELVTQIEGMR